MIEPLGTSRRPLAGRYVLVDELGAGATGSVWRAWDLRRQDWCAAKVLGHAHASALLRFVREQSLRIEHPHVVAPTGWAAEDGLAVLTMDLVRGGSVADLPRPLPEDYVAALLDQLLQALGAVHAAGVVHRDVKPANLLLEASGTGRPHLRLADFGVAALLDDPRLTVLPGGVGTPGFWAPEQEAGAAPDPRQDLYAAGRVALGLLAAPGRLGPLLGHLTARDPAARPASATAALVELRRLGLRSPARWPAVPDRLPDVAIPVSAALHLPRGAVPGRRPTPSAAATRAGSAVLGAIACFAGAIGLSAAALARVVGQ